ncbi:hypothetical protein [Paraburkholderia sp.]|uniref:hypothetical protein n=1 Tax=Paraburkholderia sp. TaxID=1926495 RepID=UPI002D6B2C1F|nr:hypothetical protein [Paraburkholderia sp.]HEV2606758.1 hypothetical protein [Xanthomonadaceae bacterium]HZZ04083.1 hypothetical protein [Paraburkholderia sp.]
MKDPISFECATSTGIDTFDVLAEVGRLYLCCNRHTRKLTYFDSRVIDRTVAEAKAAARKQAEPAEMIAGELIGFEQDTLTDRFALALAGVMGTRRCDSDEADYRQSTVSGIWERAAALAAGRPAQ